MGMSLGHLVFQRIVQSPGGWGEAGVKDDEGGRSDVVLQLDAAVNGVGQFECRSLLIHRCPVSHSSHCCTVP